MTKTVCDICGKEMSSIILTKCLKDYNFAISTCGRVWDICPKCRDELNEWIKAKGNGERGDQAE